MMRLKNIVRTSRKAGQSPFVEGLLEFKLGVILLSIESNLRMIIRKIESSKSVGLLRQAASALSPPLASTLKSIIRKCRVITHLGHEALPPTGLLREILSLLHVGLRQRAPALLPVCLLLSSIATNAQTTINSLQGEVTFTTSENVYIRFSNTDEVSVGDTIFKGSISAIPCLKIERKSSTSVIGIRIQDCGLTKGDTIHVRIGRANTIEDWIRDSTNSVVAVDSTETIVTTDSDTLDKVPQYEEQIRGRISTATYSSLSPSRNRHRAMTRFSLNAQHINNSKFSLESYINYRQNFIGSADTSGRQTKFFRVYNMAVTYDVDPTMSISLGRKINRKISSLGAIDGLQVEKYIGNSYVGVITGLKPDIIDFGLNPRLFQYGVYGGFHHDSERVWGETTFGLIEQRNSGQIDRRYGYLQHSSNINRKLNLFTSLEVDLYSNTNGVSGIKPRVTSLYSSARYKVNRSISFTVSYDTRKRIIYYETLRTEIEKLLADDIARQGLRFRMNLRPMNYVYTGVSVSRRFQSGQQNKSDNINGFVSLSRLPGVGGRMSVNYNWNKSNYLKSQVVSLRYSRSLIDRKLDGSLYYRRVNYAYTNNETTVRQNYLGAGLSYRFSKRWMLSLLGEQTNRSGEKSYRINTKLIKRF